MKRTIILLLLVLSCLFQIHAQTTVPNGGFENWSTYSAGSWLYDLPDQWKTTDSVTLANSSGLSHSAFKEVSLIHSGSFSMHLQSWTYIVFPGIPGCATNGDAIINTSAGTITPFSGSPDTVLHSQLNGFFQYTAGGNGADSGSIEICFFKRNTLSGNRDTVATGKTYFRNQGSWAQFSVNVSQYASTYTIPDSMLIWIQSSPRTPPSAGQTGSVLLIDSLYFTGVIAGVKEAPSALTSMQIYPVPASGELTVDLDLKNQVRTSFEIIDITGKRVLTYEMNSSKEKIKINMLSTGNYFYHLIDEQGNRLSSGKFSVGK